MLLLFQKLFKQEGTEGDGSGIAWASVSYFFNAGFHPSSSFITFFADILLFLVLLPFTVFSHPLVTLTLPFLSLFRFILVFFFPQQHTK